MYSTKDVLKKLSISKPTLYKLCKKKSIEPLRIGNHYRYTDIDLKKLLSQEFDDRKIDDKFVSLVNDVWLTLVEFSNEIWKDQGETKLKEILLRNKENIFILNVSTFKEKT